LEIQKRTVTLDSKLDPIKIYPLGCMHIEHAGCQIDRLKADVKKISTEPNSFWIGLGDAGDYIHYLDKRFDPESLPAKFSIKDLATWGEVVNEEVEKILQPIAHKCLGVHMGNHEWTFFKKYGFNPAEDLAERLKTKYLAYEAFTLLQVKEGNKGRYSCRIFSTHGFGGGRKTGGAINNIVDLTVNYEADIYFMAHVHKIGSTKEAQCGITDRCEFKKNDKAYCISGTYLDSKQIGLTGYEVRMGGKPSSVGCPHVTVWCNSNYEKQMAVTI